MDKAKKRVIVMTLIVSYYEGEPSLWLQPPNGGDVL